MTSDRNSLNHHGFLLSSNWKSHARRRFGLLFFVDISTQRAIWDKAIFVEPSLHWFSSRKSSHEYSISVSVSERYLLVVASQKSNCWLKRSSDTICSIGSLHSKYKFAPNWFQFPLPFIPKGQRHGIDAMVFTISLLRKLWRVGWKSQKWILCYWIEIFIFSSRRIYFIKKFPRWWWPWAMFPKIVSFSCSISAFFGPSS